MGEEENPSSPYLQKLLFYIWKNFKATKEYFKL